MPTDPPPTPLVSVIIPVYNTERYLEEALQSVRAQSLTDFEILVVDDGSTDDSARIAQSIAQDGAQSIAQGGAQGGGVRGGDVRYFYQKRGGAGSARNLGVEGARGEFIAFLDADDVWTPDKLALQVECARALPAERAATLIFGHSRQFFSPDLGAKSRATVRLPDAAQPAPLASALLVSRADFWKIGPYAPGVGVDIDWYLRARDGGARIHMLPQTLFYRRIHDTNTSRVQPGRSVQLAHAVKASLDRRRQAEHKTVDKTA